MTEKHFVSRAGAKLDHALDEFDIDVTNLICADLGCSTGGFTDCLLQRGAQKVYAVDTGYGVLDWKLRNDPRVVVMERQNALHAEFPEQLDFITIDAGWTLQKHIIPAALKHLKPTGQIVTLVKPHYEAGQKALVNRKLPDEKIPQVLDKVRDELKTQPITIIAETPSPLTGEKGGNQEFLFFIKLK